MIALSRKRERGVTGCRYRHRNLFTVKLVTAPLVTAKLVTT